MINYIRAVANSPRRLGWVTLANVVTCSALYSLLEKAGPISGMWWSIVTGSTVGYGDFYPQDTAGRGVAGYFIVSSVVLTILWGAHVNRAFINDPDAWTNSEQRLLLRQVKSLLRITSLHVKENRETARLVRENNAMLRAIIERDHGTVYLNDLLKTSEDHINA